MNYKSNIFTGLVTTAGAVTLTVLIFAGLTAQNSDYTVVRQIAMGWPLFLLAGITCAVGLRVATWPKGTEAETEEHVQTGTIFKTAA